MTRSVRWLLTAGLAAALGPVAVRAQSLIDSGSLTLAPSYRRWSFIDPITVDSLSVKRADQFTLPISISVSPLRNVTLDVSAAYARSTISYSAPGSLPQLELSGFTDAKIRAAARLLGDRLWLTLGTNVPTGKDRLGGDEATVIRAIGSPVLRMRTPALGNGTGITGGFVYTGVVGRWAVGLGASYEIRGSYTPLEAALAGSTTLSDLDPAEAVHFSLGFDRILGQGRMSFLFVGDRYGTDAITLRSGTGPGARATYQLGPTFGAHWSYAFATPGLRQVFFRASDRYRTRFKAGDRGTIAGSSGNSADVGFGLTSGRPGSVGLVVGLDGVFDSGLTVDNTLATAAMNSGTGTLGLEIPLGRLIVRPFGQLTYGKLDLGPASTTARAVSAGLTITTTW